jgi:hypothetical protein
MQVYDTEDIDENMDDYDIIQQNNIERLNQIQFARNLARNPEMYTEGLGKQISKQGPTRYNKGIKTFKHSKLDNYKNIIKKVKQDMINNPEVLYNEDKLFSAVINILKSKIHNTTKGPLLLNDNNEAESISEEDISIILSFAFKDLLQEEEHSECIEKTEIYRNCILSMIPIKYKSRFESHIKNLNHRLDVLQRTEQTESDNVIIRVFNRIQNKEEESDSDSD